MSVSADRDAPGASDKAVGTGPATDRSVRIDTRHCLFLSCQYGFFWEGTEWNHQRCAESFHQL